MKLKTLGLILLVAGVALICFGLLSSVFSTSRLTASGPYLTVKVTDSTTGSGISGAYVYFFANGEGVLPPEDADATRMTDNEGNVLITALGFIRIGVIADGYTSDSSVAGYSHWGTVNVAGDVTYSVMLHSGTPSESTLPTIDSLIENKTFYSLIIGGVLAFAGLVCVVVDKFRN